MFRLRPIQLARRPSAFHSSLGVITVLTQALVDVLGKIPFPKFDGSLLAASTHLATEDFFNQFETGKSREHRVRIRAVQWR
jgi:hypothetical protein